MVPYPKLRPSNVTVASRIMLPAYPGLAVVLGLNYTIQAERLAASPALSAADNVLPLEAWGTMFGVAAIVLVVSLLFGWWRGYIAGLCCLAAAMFVWTGVFVYAGATGPVSWTAPAWPAFTLAACWATIRSLTVDRPGGSNS